MKPGELSVLIVTYARSRQVENLIQKAISADIKKIIVWIDGPRNVDVAQNQEETVRKIQDIKREHSEISLKIFRSNENFGAAASVLAGSTLMFSEAINGVILEDDLDVDKSFFEDISKGLELAESDPNIWMVTGSRLLLNTQELYWETLNYPVGWGWATTRDKWDEISSALSRLQSLQPIQGFSRRGFWKVGYRRAMEGFTDAWDTPLAAIMFAEGKECLIPPVNLVTNIGNDEYATHTRKTRWPIGITRQPLPVTHSILKDHFNLRSNNIFYEKNVFKIRLRHTWAPIYDSTLRQTKIKKSKKLKPLISRIETALRNTTEIQHG